MRLSLGEMLREVSDSIFNVTWRFMLMKEIDTFGSIASNHSGESETF